MKVGVVGIGAVGTVLAARLTLGGLDVSAVARGATLEAIRDRGLQIDDAGGTQHCRLAASDDARDLGPQDCVLIATKAHAIAGALPAIVPLLGPDTAVVSVVNGVPWWYFHALAGEWPARHLDSVDPGGRIWQAIGPGRAIGCVTYVAAASRGPGHVHHSFGDDFVIGEPDGSLSARLRELSAALPAGGLRWPESRDIRGEMWLKLWGNLSANPITAICRAKMGDLLTDPPVRRLVCGMMAEAQRVGEAMGAVFPGTIEERLAAFEKIADFKTSMLQDVEAGKSVELDPIVGAVAELGRLAGVPTPAIDAVYAVARLQARLAGLYGRR